VRLELVEPRLERQHRLPPQAEDAQPRVIRNALVGDKTGLEQDAEVPAHHWSGRPGSLSQFARAARPVAEQLDHPAPCRISERQKDILHVIRHLANYSIWIEQSSARRDLARTLRWPLVPDLVNREDVQRLVAEGAQLVEALPREAYDDLHLAGAVSIPLRELGERARRELDREKPVVVYCNDFL
jgi:hypothetical protein